MARQEGLVRRGAARSSPRGKQSTGLFHEIFESRQLCTSIRSSAPACDFRRNGTPGGTRTPDLLLRRQLLYPAELLARIDGAGDGNRTRVSSLEGWCSTIELHPRKSMIRPIQPVNSSTDFPRCQGETRIFSGAPETAPQYPTHSRNQEIPQTAEAASREEHSSRKSTHRPELTVR